VLRASGGFAFGLALVPALPGPLFASLGAALFVIAALADRRRRCRTEEERQARESSRRAAIRRPETALGLVGVDALTIEFGLDLGRLLTPPLAEALLDRIGEIRRGLAVEIGIVMPGVRLRDDLTRESATYAIRVRDVLAGEGRLRLDGVLAVADEAIVARFGGEAAREPVYGLPACWIPTERRADAESAGALVFDPVSIVGSHLAEIVRSHAAELLGRQELHTMLEHLRAGVPSLVKEIGPESVPLSVVQRTFELLLRERVWPRDVIATLETIVEAAASTRDPRELAEAVRKKIVPEHLRRRRLDALEPLLLSPEFESELRSWFGQGESRPELAVRLRSIAAEYASSVVRERAALVCAATVRSSIAEFFRRVGIRLDVYAYGELPPELELRPALIATPA
jgi:flagellar biosynthesis protein FlhA